MTGKWNLLFASIATTLLLSACGTDTATKNPEGSTNGSTGVVEETDQETTNEAAGSQDDVLHNAVQTTSAEQNYTIDVLPNYKLISEEPGKDSLLIVDNESVFMRIETMAIEDGIYDYLAENMVAVLEAASGGATPTELTDTASAPSGEGVEHAKVLSVQGEAGSITGVIFERDGMIVRLTIFDSPKDEHYTEFLRMGETIVHQ